jgi:hypothetical protein
VPTPGAAPSSTAYYGPRFDYDPLTLAPKGILVEEARTNLALYSEQFDNAAWTKNAVTVTANTAVSPDGTTNADTLTANGTSTTHVINQTSAAGSVRVFSVYLKAGTNNFAQIFFDADVAPWANFNLAAGVVGSTGSNQTAAIIAVGNGWYRCSVYTSSLTASNPNIVVISSATATRYESNSLSTNFFLWGAQLEAGAFATSYIPTIASTVTRSADVATITGSLFSQWYAQNEGSFVAIFTAAQNTFTTYLAASNGVVAQNSMHMDNDGSGNMRVAYYSGSSAVALLSLGATGTVGTINILGTAYRANDFAASRNGGTVVSDTAGAVPVGVNRLNIGADPSGAAVNVSNGHIRYAAYYPVRLSDSQLQTLTSSPEQLSTIIYDRFNATVLDRDGQTIEVR